MTAGPFAIACTLVYSVGVILIIAWYWDDDSEK